MLINVDRYIYKKINKKITIIIIIKIIIITVASFHRGPAIKHFYNHTYYNDKISI